MSLTIICGDALTELRNLPVESVQCCVTSPPYWNLRDYQTGQWEGGEAGCDHAEPPRGGRNPETAGKQLTNGGTLAYQYAQDCGKCGARRIDSQLGLEKTPEEYVRKMVAVFREVRRVLRRDGTLWLNLGSSYAGSGKGGNPEGSEWSGFVGNKDREKSAQASPQFVPPGFKPKDLVPIPWMVAMALQADGWWLRSDIIWAKPNPMPESVTDRCTKSHEYLFMLSKSASYYFDAEAIKERSEYPDDDRKARASNGQKRYPDEMVAGVREGSATYANRNKRSVWTVATAPYPEAHFATYPPDLIKPCIMAGTSAKGCCAKCGAPWERIVEISYRSEAQYNRDAAQWKTTTKEIIRYGDGKDTKTLGWQPTCKCERITCATCSIVLEYSSNTTEVLEHGERLEKESRRYKELQKLFSQFYGQGVGRQIQGVLHKDVRCEVDDESQEQEAPVRRQDNKLSRIPDAMESRNTELRHGTSCFNAGILGQAVTENGGRSSHRRRQIKQQDGELGFADSAGAQCAAEESKAEKDHLSSLQEEFDGSVECPICGTQLLIEPFETEPCTVADIFAGSGTTGAVALELGRRAVLIELNPKYVELIEQRCNVTMGLQLA